MKNGIKILAMSVVIALLFNCNSEESVDEQSSLISDESLVGENSSESIITGTYYNITSNRNGLNLSNRNHSTEAVISLSRVDYAGRSEQMWECELGQYSGSTYTWCYLKNKASGLYLKADGCPGSETDGCQIIQSASGAQWSVYDSDFGNVKIVNTATGYYLKTDENGDLTLSSYDSETDVENEVSFTLTER